METIAVRRIGETSVRVGVGDLTREPVDAIVNAANEYLAHGGGVAAAIVRTGGRVIQEESDTWVTEHGPVGRGQAAVTTGGMLPASHVIHVVGPRFRSGQDNEAMLSDATRAALDAAASTGVESVAFPAISAGIFGYPPPEATAVMVATIVEWLDRHPGELTEIRLVGFSRDIADLFAASLKTVAS